jgi:hypothetical protein
MMRGCHGELAAATGTAGIALIVGLLVFRRTKTP